MERKLKKRLLIGFSVILAVVVLGVVVLVLNLGVIVQHKVTKAGSAILGVPVTLENADVSLRGVVGLDGLKIGSPEGYNAPEMFKLDHAHVEADVMSLLGGEILLHNVVIDGAEVTFELSGGKSNWGVLLKRLRQKAEREEEADKKKMRIDHIIFPDGKVHLAGIPTVDDPTLSLPKVELHDIGKEKEARSVPDTMLVIVGGLYAAILKAADDVLPAEQMQKLTVDIGDAIGEAIGGAAGGAATQGKEAWDNLFGGKDDGEKE